MTSLSDCITVVRIRVSWTCSWAFSLVWFVVPDSCGFLPRTYRRWSVFPLFIGQGLRRKYRRRPLGGIMKFQTPIDGRGWARERERGGGMCTRIARYINGFRLYINWVGLVVLCIEFFFFGQDALRFGWELFSIFVLIFLICFVASFHWIWSVWRYIYIYIFLKLK